MNNKKFVVPGELLCDNEKEYNIGNGVFLGSKVLNLNCNDGIYSSILGECLIDKENKTISVINDKVLGEKLVPIVGSIVTGKITRVTQRYASIDILCIGNKPLISNFQGVIRKENVRAIEVDRVDLYDCFRPGDIVKCVVISMGSARLYELSTAKNQYGVIFAKSEEADCEMVPISWEEMQCPITMQVEKRKVAKV